MSNHGDHDHLELANQNPPATPWHLKIIGVPEAWSAGYASSPSIGVAVIDSGIDVREGFAHRHLGDNNNRWPEGSGGRRGVVRAWDFVRNRGGRYDIFDRFGHGTKMAGIIGALPRAFLATRAGNRETYLYAGALGVAPNCRLINLRVADKEGEVKPNRVRKACEFVGEKNSQKSRPWHTDVALLALEDEIWRLEEQEVQERFEALKDGLKELYDAGVVVIISAGDHLPEGKTLGEGPWLAFPNALMVTATQGPADEKNPKPLSELKRLPTANYGPAVHLAAPGEDIMTTAPMAPTPAFGTSAAAAIVAGAAALVCGKVNRGHERRPEKVVEILRAATTESSDPKLPPVIDLTRL